MATAKTEKVTFSLPADLVRQMREAVQKGGVASQNALVREAEFEREMEEAARDPLFMQDLTECMHDFRFVDAESSHLIAEDEEFEAQP